MVDSGNDAVYEYDRTSGTFLGSFALDIANANPQGIADPPPTASAVVATPGKLPVATIFAQLGREPRDPRATRVLTDVIWMDPTQIIHNESLGHSVEVAVHMEPRSVIEWRSERHTTGQEGLENVDQALRELTESPLDFDF